MKPALDNQIHELLQNKLIAIDEHFGADVLSYYGPFEGGSNNFLKIVEELANDPKKKGKIYLIWNHYKKKFN